MHVQNKICGTLSVHYSDSAAGEHPANSFSALKG